MVYFSLRKVCENFLLLPVYVAVLVVMASAIGGIDLITYKANSDLPLSMWGIYFYKEFFSWGLIKLSYSLSDYFGLDQPILVLSFILLAIFRCFNIGSNIDARYLPLIILGPLSVLLAFNVLRQYIAVIFFCIALIMLMRRRFLLFCLAGLLAFFSHNSIIFLLYLVVVSYFLSLGSAMFMVFVFQAAVLFADRFLGVGIYNTDLLSASGGVSESVKVVFYFLYVVFLFLLFSKTPGVRRTTQGYFLKKLSLTLLFFAVMVVVFPWSSWMTNRFLIYIGFTYSFFLLLQLDEWRIQRGRYNLFVAIFVVVSVVATLMHGGAMSMLSFGTAA